MPYNDFRIKKLVKKNIIMLKRNYLVGCIILMNLIILLSNVSSCRNNVIGFLRKDVFESIAYQFIPILLVILFGGTYWNELSGGEIKVDLLFGYTRNEIIGTKLSVRIIASMLLFWLPFAAIYITLHVVGLCSGVTFLDIDATKIFMVLKHGLIYAFFCIYLNSTFLAVLLTIRMPFGDKMRLLITEIILLIGIWFVWDDLYIKIGLSILNLLISIKAFHKVDFR